MTTDTDSPFGDVEPTPCEPPEGNDDLTACSRCGQEVPRRVTGVYGQCRSCRRAHASAEGDL